jgi:hypothetical protein
MKFPCDTLFEARLRQSGCCERSNKTISGISEKEIGEREKTVWWHEVENFLLEILQIVLPQWRLATMQAATETPQILNIISL